MKTRKVEYRVEWWVIDNREWEYVCRLNSLRAARVEVKRLDSYGFKARVVRVRYTEPEVVK